ncbi:MAG: cobalamin B12-binding domain-containing protein [Rhodopirellula sp.]|nr:cobalamin B12-binding domain-containing protein [Rhodopirellula sp.]
MYGGIWQSPAAIAQTVRDEDADWLGLSFLNGAHVIQMSRLMEALREAHLSDVRVLAGGIIPEQDFATLEQAGVHS